MGASNEPRKPSNFTENRILCNRTIILVLQVHVKRDTPTDQQRHSAFAEVNLEKVC